MNEGKEKEREMYKRKENLFDNICPTLAKHQWTNIPTQGF